VIPARQIAALLVVGIVAAAVGFAAAAALGGSSAPPPPPLPAAATAPASPPEEALLSPAPPEVDPAADITAADAPAAPPEPSPEPEPAPQAPRRASPRDPEPAPAPQPPASTSTPAEPPAPSPATAPTTGPAPQPEPPAPPTVPSATALEEPEPPTGVAIPPGAEPSGFEPARRLLAEALTRASEGSVDSRDIRRNLALWRAYLSPDAAPAPEGRRSTIARALRANGWWFASRGSPRGRVLLRDEDGVILTYRAGQGFVVNPVATTGRWRGLNDDVPAPALAEGLLEMGVPRRAGERRFLAWEYYDAAGDPEAIRPGISGMAQARVALLMAHAEAQSGDPRFSAAAVEALAALTVDVDAGGARSMVAVSAEQAPMMWFVERAYPGESPWKGAALNGFMVTILNLQGVAALLDRSPGPGADGPAAAALARDLADRGARTLARHLPDHDSGAWSYYGLLTPGRPWRTYLADLNYHCYHVRLLAQLAEPYPDLGFAETSARWQGYVDQAGATCPVR
jgi:hypothetical protein